MREDAKITNFMKTKSAVQKNRQALQNCKIYLIVTGTKRKVFHHFNLTKTFSNYFENFL